MYGHRLRRIDLKKGAIEAFAGTGKRGYTGDGGKAIDATFDGPKEIDIDRDGNVYVVDTGSGNLLQRIRTGWGPHGLTYFPQPGRYCVGHNGVYR